MMERFAENGVQPVDLDGRLVYPMLTVPVEAGTRVTVTWLSALPPSAGADASTASAGSRTRQGQGRHAARRIHGGSGDRPLDGHRATYGRTSGRRSRS